MHHGKIWMDSMGIPGKGSTFSFTLPVPKTEE
jgi:signal transduction histidine kinase